MIKSIFKKSSANIILIRERLGTFLLKIRNETRVLLLPVLLNIVLEILTSEIKHEERNFQKDWEKRGKLSLFIDKMVLFYRIFSSKNSGKLLEIMGKFSKLARYKTNKHKSIAFLKWSNN